MNNYCLMKDKENKNENCNEIVGEYTAKLDGSLI